MKNNKWILSAAFALTIMSTVHVNAEIIAGWGLSGPAASTKHADFSAVRSFGPNVQYNFVGSTDGTFGTVAGAPVSTGSGSTGSYKFGVGTYIDYTFTNSASTAWELEAFHFDSYRRRAISQKLELVVLAGGGITAGTIAFDNVPYDPDFAAVSTSDWGDVDILMTGLADHILAPGESVTFRISGVDGTNYETWIDNEALTGTAIPEPTTLGLIGTCSIGIMLVRRLKM